ncbi:MAG: type II toxin-antitoxin system VapC family toxin [Coriobacteriales bacterium]|nr:type II toxin-antitoxin system VapC family toxin [Coriobacteriales bacterium]
MVSGPTASPVGSRTAYTACTASAHYIVDTNIISETLKKKPNENVIAWLFQHETQLYLTAITIAELFTGAYRLPRGKRRENLLLAIEQISDNYERNILPFDGSSARIYAQMQDESRRAGYTLTVENGMIAAISAAAKATLATRNTKDFVHLGIRLINPFEEQVSDVSKVEL